jgi:hypothetical protein
MMPKNMSNSHAFVADIASSNNLFELSSIYRNLSSLSQQEIYAPGLHRNKYLFAVVSGHNFDILLSARNNQPNLSEY